MKPTVFIAASSADVKILDALEDRLKDRVTVKEWIDGHQELGRDILEWAISEAPRVRIVVASPKESFIRLGGSLPGGGAVSRGVERCAMIQITAQMRILVAVGAVDFRCGIDGLARLCRDHLDADPFCGPPFCCPIIPAPHEITCDMHILL